MPAGIGLPSFLGYAKETAWGTPVAAAYWAQVLSVEPEEEHDRPDDEALYGTFGRREPFSGAQLVRVGLSADARPQLLCHLLRSLCGPPTSTLVGGETAVWDHVFKYPRQAAFADACYPNPYTLEIFRDIQAQSKQYAGCGVDSLTLSLSTGDKILRAEAALIGKLWPVNVTKSTPTMPTLKPWLFHQAAITIAAAAHHRMDEFSLQLSNSLEGALRLAGTRIIEELFPGGHPEGVISGTSMPREATEYDAYLAETTRVMEITLTGEAVGSATNHRLTITIPRALYRSYSLPVSGPGRLSASWEALAAYDPASAFSVQLTVRTNIPNTELA